MVRNLYITGTESGSGKSVVALGLMETLAGRSQKAGFFRPIVPSREIPDAQVELIRSRYRLSSTYEEMHALSAEEAHALIAAGRQDELEQQVFDAYKRLEQRFEVIVCEGTDFVGVLPALDFDLNATLANQLGCPVLVVIRGSSVDGIASAVRVARASLTSRNCSLFGVIVNRVPAQLLAEMRAHSVMYDPNEPLYVLPEDPALGHATVAQVARELHARVLVGGDGRLAQEVREVRVAAMSVEHFLDDLADGTLVVVSGDRADIMLASLAASQFSDPSGGGRIGPDRRLSGPRVDPATAQTGPVRGDRGRGAYLPDGRRGGVDQPGDHRRR